MIWYFAARCKDIHTLMNFIHIHLLSDGLNTYCSKYFVILTLGKSFTKKTNNLSTKCYKQDVQKINIIHQNHAFIQVTKLTYKDDDMYRLWARLCPELLAVDANSPASLSLFNRLLSSCDNVGTLTGTPSDLGRWAAPIPQRIAFPFMPCLRASLVSCASKTPSKEFPSQRRRDWACDMGEQI